MVRDCSMREESSARRSGVKYCARKWSRTAQRVLCTGSARSERVVVAARNDVSA